MLFSMRNINESIEMIKFNKIDNEIDKINEQTNNEIDKNESISNIEENKKSLIQRDLYLFHRRSSVLRKVHSEITFLAVSKTQIVQEI